MTGRQQNNFWSNVLIASLVIIFCAWLLLYLLKDYVFGYILPLLIIILLACMYSSRYYQENDLFKPSKYLYPVFVALSISFGVISLIFGLHTDILIAYDQSDEADRDGFMWLRPDSILAFPKNQLESREKIPEKSISFKSYIDSSVVCHIIIVDKTRSVLNSDDFINIPLMSLARASFSDMQSFPGKTTADLSLAFMLSASERNARNGHDEAVCVFLYDGMGDDFKNTFENSYTIRASELKRDQAVNKYFRAVNDLKNRGKYSSVNAMLRILGRKMDSIDELKNFQKYKLTLISDFVNTDSREVSSDIKDIIPKIDELYTIVLKGEERTNRKYSPAMLVSDMLNSIKHSKENNSLLLNRDGPDKSIGDNIAYFGFKKHNLFNRDKIKVYYPYIFFNSNQSSQVKISINGLDTNGDLSDIYLKVTNIDDQDNYGYFKVRQDSYGNAADQTVNIGSLYKVRMNSRDNSMIITFPNASVFNGKRLNFEIGSSKYNMTQSYAVSFLPVMPKTTCIYLVFCYCVFGLGVSITLLLPNLFVLIHVGKPGKFFKSKPLLNTLALILPVTLGLFLMYKVIGYYWETAGRGSLIILAVLLMFSVPTFCYRVTDFTEIGTFSCMPRMRNRPGKKPSTPDRAADTVAPSATL